jgi:signal transduction histidine kinase
MEPDGLGADRVSPHLEGVARGWARGQARIAVPIVLAIVIVLVSTGYPWWRGIAILVSQPLFVVVRRVAARHRSLEQHVLVGWLALILGNTTIVALSGGLHSPLLPMFVGPPFGAMMTYGRGPRGQLLFAVTLAATALLALLPPSVRGPPTSPLAFSFACTLAALMSFVMGRNGLAAIGDAYRRDREQLERMRGAMLDEARQRVRSLETIGARVGHELKNPLTALKGLVPLLSRDARDERARARFEVVIQEIARMEETVRGYLSFSRPLDDLQLGEVALGQVVANVFAVIEGRAAASGVRLELQDRAGAIEGDEHRLRDALLNLIANALDATGRGGRVRVDLIPDGDGVCLTVDDTGAGMPSEVLERLGRPFFSTKEQGTGLGVVLARATVEQHGGTLRFASEVGRGTVATLCLPARVPPAKRPQPLSVT